jgi:hypothetical protein
MFATLNTVVVNVVLGMREETLASDVAGGFALPNGRVFQNRLSKQNTNFHSDLSFF